MNFEIDNKNSAELKKLSTALSMRINYLEDICSVFEFKEMNSDIISLQDYLSSEVYVLSNPYLVNLLKELHDECLFQLSLGDESGFFSCSPERIFFSVKTLKLRFHPPEIDFSVSQIELADVEKRIITNYLEIVGLILKKQAPADQALSFPGCGDISEYNYSLDQFRHFYSLTVEDVELTIRNITLAFDTISKRESIDKINLWQSEVRTPMLVSYDRQSKSSWGSLLLANGAGNPEDEVEKHLEYLKRL